MPACTKISTIALAAIAALALAVSGCGESKDAPTATPTGATQSVAPTPTGAATGVTGKSSLTSRAANSLQHAYESCLNAANIVQDDSRRSQALAQCKKLHDSAMDAINSGRKSLKNTREACEKNAKQANSEAIKRMMEDNCKKLPQ